MDKILLTGLQFYAYHGVLAEEKTLGQKFSVDLELFRDLRQAGETDNLNLTVNYAQVYQAVKEIVEGTRYNLIEALAERLAADLLHKFSLAGVLIRVNKPQAPLPGIFANAGVEIKRGVLN